MRGLPSKPSGCTNPDCTRGWTARLRDQRRPIFEEDWACSRACVEELVRTAIARESDETPLQSGNHLHRLPLGLLLLERGWITRTDLQRALELQRRSGRGPIGTLLVEQGALGRERITRALALQWGCPVVPLEDFKASAMALAMPRLLMDALGIVPFRIAAQRILYLASIDRLDASAAFAIERMSGLKVVHGLAQPGDWMTARRLLSACDGVDAQFTRVADAAALARSMAAALCEVRPRASRLARVHRFYWLRLWLEEGAMHSSGVSLPFSREDVADRIYLIGREQ